MIAIVEYGMGNPGSIQNMLTRLGVESTISCDPEVIRNAEKFVLPGVGAFDAAVKELTRRGLFTLLHEEVAVRGKSILGICLGMQLFTRRSEEGTLAGFGWLDAETVRFRLPPTTSLRVPHMGWNTVRAQPGHPLFRDMFPEPRFYFVHSYHVTCKREEDVLARAEHGMSFVAAIARGNVLGTQFHPEKSHKYGLRLLANFAAMR